MDLLDDVICSMSLVLCMGPDIWLTIDLFSNALCKGLEYPVGYTILNTSSCFVMNSIFVDLIHELYCIRSLINLHLFLCLIKC